MGQDLFKYLPSEIMLDILSRLPAPTAMKCKCVCKPWLDLLSTPKFVKSHLSKSVPCMAVFLEEEDAKPYRLVESEDERGLNIAFNFDLPLHEPLIISVNGLVLLWMEGLDRGGHLSLCNPITRDYIRIPSPPRGPYDLEEVYGFGVSRMSGQYKVVRFFIGKRKPDQVAFQVYTVGTGLWRRRIASDGRLSYGGNEEMTFLSGNLHLLAYKGSSTLISCLDLETEVLNTFSPPPLDDDIQITRKLFVLGDCLCACDNSWQASGCEIDIWLMKEYGIEKSWTKQFVMRTVYMDESIGFIYPIKVFKDGDILMTSRGCNCKLLRYSSHTKTIQPVDDVFGSKTFVSIDIFCPSFLSLKTFTKENVFSF